MGFLDFFKGGKNPANYAREYLAPVPGYGREAYQPWIERGNTAYGKLEPEYAARLNPRERLNQDVAGYEPSEQYQIMNKYLMDELEKQARAGGYYSTDMYGRKQGELAHELLSMDLSKYLDRLENIRSPALEGFERATNRGFEGSGQLADYLGNAAGNRANLEFAGKSQQESQKAALINALISAAASGFGAYMGMPKPNGGGGTSTSSSYTPNDYARSLRTTQTHFGLPGYGR